MRTSEIIMLMPPALRTFSASSPDADGDGLKALAAQEGIQQAALPGVVIHDQDARPFWAVLARFGSHRFKFQG